ncbi:hypothetical protein [Halorubrum sp. 48-1-W]|nr:hypothetical protein [Halorubrum sp. 48-1-W]
MSPPADGNGLAVPDDRMRARDDRMRARDDRIAVGPDEREHTPG